DEPALATISGDRTNAVATLTGTSGVLHVHAVTINGKQGDATVTLVTPPARIVTVSGSGQTADAGGSPTNPFVVQVQSASGDGVPNQTVTFTASGGSITPSTVTTGSDGRAQATMTLGNTVGSYTYTATSGSFTTTATATANAGPVAAL